MATLLRSGVPYQLTPGALLEPTMITSGAMTNRIDRLEDRGFLKRVKSPDDGRQVLVTLTANGRKKTDRALVDHAANELALVACLDNDQRTQFVYLLRTLGTSITTDQE